jgi:hypothetical protein
MRKLWITDTPYPASEDVVADAEAAGATEILHGIPQSLRDVIPETVGYYELADPVYEAEPDSAEVIAAEAILEEVSALLTPSSVNSIAEVKAAVIDGMSAAVARLRQ